MTTTPEPVDALASMWANLPSNLLAASQYAAVVQAEQSKRIADAATEINDNLDRIASLLADRFIDAPLRRAHTLEELQAELAKTRSDHDANLAVMAEMGPAYEALEAVVASVVERLDAAEAADQRGELAPKWTDRRVIRDELRGALEGGESRG